MTIDYHTWPSWLVVAGIVIVAAIAFWIFAKVLKWFLWLILLAVLAVCVLALFHRF